MISTTSKWRMMVVLNVFVLVFALLHLTIVKNNAPHRSPESVSWIQDSFLNQIPESHFSKRAGWSPNFQRALQKGEGFLSKFPGGPCENPQEVNQFPIKDMDQPASEIKAAFDRWGWSDMDADGELDTDLTIPLQNDGIDLKDLNTKYVYYYQNQRYATNSDQNGKQTGVETDGYFSGYYNANKGIIIPTDNVSPKHASPQLKVLPDLQRWSDVAWLIWIGQCAGNKAFRQGIQSFYRSHITNDSGTQDIINEALGISGRDDPNFKVVPNGSNTIPGQTFDMTTDQGKALLGTAHGRGIAYFLFTHQDPDTELGKKTVDTITVFKTTDSTNEIKYNMLFRVKNL